MGQPFLGEIRIFAGNFAPSGWMFCDGTMLPISQNDTLFSLIGTTYGGDGQQTFGIPDLRGRVPIHWPAALGATGGSENVTLVVNELPVHNHPLLAMSNSATEKSPQSNLAAQTSFNIYDSANPQQSLAPASVGFEGGDQPHENRMPFIAVNYIISLFGTIPSST